MRQFLLLNVLATALSVGCASEADDTAGAGGKADDQYGGALLYVFDNGIRCVRSPCFSYTVVESADYVYAVSDVDMLPDVETPGVHAEGLLVRGSTTDNGEDGVILFIREVVGAPATYTVEKTNIECITAPCPYFSVTNAQGEVFDVASIEHTQGWRSEAFEALLAQGPVTIRGFLAEGSWLPFDSGNVLWVGGWDEPAATCAGHCANGCAPGFERPTDGVCGEGLICCERLDE